MHQINITVLIVGQPWKLQEDPSKIQRECKVYFYSNISVIFSGIY